MELTQNNKDPNYRNKDYEHHKVKDWDIDLTSRLIALYARVDIDPEKDAPDLAENENDELLSMDRRRDIGSAISTFFDKCRALATQDRFQTRYVQTGVSMHGRTDLDQFEKGHQEFTMFGSGEGPSRTHQLTDNFTDDLNRFAMESLLELTDALNGNNAFAAMDPETRAAMDDKTLFREAHTNESMLFGEYYGSPKTDLNRRSHPETVTVRDGKGQLKPFDEIKSDSSQTFAYDMMIGIAKTIETYTADDLAKELASKKDRGMATRMLFKKEADLSFQRATEEMKARETVTVPSR